MPGPALPRRHRLHPPRLGPQDVERPRLHALILDTPPGGTCLLSAPPGFGATTAVAQALAREARVAWISLDSRDESPLQLAVQLQHAVQGPTPEAMPGPAREVNGVDASAALEAVVDALPESTIDWIVVDGVTTASHAHLMEGLGYLLENVPPRVRVAVTTHDSPRLMPIPASDRRLSTILAEHLTATDEEAVWIVLATAPGLGLDEVEDITTSAHGVIAALRAASRYAAQHPGGRPSQWLRTRGAHDLLGPWLDGLPEGQRRFLENTAFLSELAAPLCDAVLETEDSLTHLLFLEAHGGYLTPDDPPQASGATRWWTRHPLLSAALIQRSGDDADLDRHVRAASWFEAAGDLHSTMRHLFAAGRLDAAAEKLRTHENSVFERGRGDRLTQWYAALPAESWGPAGWHLVRVGWGQAVSCDIQAALATSAQLHAHLAAARVDEQDHRSLVAEANLLEAYLASCTGDTEVAISRAQRAADLFVDESPENSQQMAPITLIRGLLWEGQVLAAARELARTARQPFPTAVLRETALKAIRAQCLVDEGRISEAQRDVSHALHWLSHHHLTATEVLQFGLLTAQGACSVESGDPAGAMPQLSASAEAALDRHSVAEGVHALLWLARAHVCLGHTSDAFTVVQRARQTLQKSAPRSRMLSRVDLAEAFLRYVAGDTVRAERLLQRVPSSEDRALMWARVTMHRQSNALRGSLAPSVHDTPRIAVDKQVLLATMALRRSAALAEGHLIKAADLADEHGQNLALLGCPQELLDFADAVATRSSHDHLARLVRRVSATGTGPDASDAQDWPAMTAAGPPLSAGELELMTFLPRRDSNAEIAEQLGISINTVKTRLYRLYRKLNVDSRNEAIEVARMRGLIP